MVNFGPMDTVPQRYRHRLLRPHNSHVTLMRTLAEEMERCAHFVLKEINRSQGPITILLPEGGLSSLDKEGGPFWNPEVNAILFHALEKGFQSGPGREIHRTPHHINDPAFANRIFASLMSPSQTNSLSPWP
jgi:uncharacterized protein (UPF0261 family)